MPSKIQSRGVYRQQQRSERNRLHKEATRATKEAQRLRDSGLTPTRRETHAPTFCPESFSDYSFRPIERTESRPRRFRARNQTDSVSGMGMFLLFLMAMNMITPALTTAIRLETQSEPSKGGPSTTAVVSPVDGDIHKPSGSFDHHEEFTMAQNQPGFGDGPINPLSMVDMTLKKLKGQVIPLQPFDNATAFSETGSFVEGNSILVTQHAEETTQLRFQMLREAKQSIELSGNFGGGEVFLETIDVIRENLQSNEDLKVHLLFSDDFIQEQETNALKSLRTDFGERVHYQITSRHFEPKVTSVENHVKLTVVDGKYMMVGGTGITDNFVTKGDQPPPDREAKTWAEMMIPKGARDQDVIVQGSLARKGRAEFFKLYKKWEEIETKTEVPLRWFHTDDTKAADIRCIDDNPRLDHETRMKLFTCSPEQEVNPCTEAIRSLIHHADKDLIVAHMYQNYVHEIEGELQEKLDEGKTPVTIITNGASGNSPRRNIVMVSTFEYPTGKALKRYFYDVPEILYHKKIIVSESEVEICVAIGSYNLGKKSEDSDDETMLVFCQKKDSEGPSVREIMEALEQDIKLSRVDETANTVEDVAKMSSIGKVWYGVKGLAREVIHLAGTPREMIGSYTV